jgi:hypothetical protein
MDMDNRHRNFDKKAEVISRITNLVKQDKGFEAKELGIQHKLEVNIGTRYPSLDERICSGKPHMEKKITIFDHENDCGTASTIPFIPGLGGYEKDKPACWDGKERKYKEEK